MSGCTARREIDKKQSVAEVSGEIKELTVEAYRWGFHTSPLVVRKGNVVRITVKSTDGTHGIVIPAFKVATRAIRKGSEEVLEFVATRSGDFTIACNVICGLGHMQMRTSFGVRE